MNEKSVKDYDKFVVRFPDGLRDAIADRAKANGRSMNSEIVQILEDAVDSKDEGMHGSDLRTLREIIKVQADLLNQYSEAIAQGTEILRAASGKNKKTT